VAKWQSSKQRPKVVVFLFVCLLGRTPPGACGKKMESAKKKTREDVVVGKSCSGTWCLWWFFERMGGLKNHYRWLTSVCSSFWISFFLFFPVLMLKILADR